MKFKKLRKWIIKLLKIKGEDLTIEEQMRFMKTEVIYSYVDPITLTSTGEISMNLFKKDQGYEKCDIQKIKKQMLDELISNLFKKELIEVIETETFTTSIRPVKKFKLILRVYPPQPIQKEKLFLS